MAKSSAHSKIRSLVRSSSPYSTEECAKHSNPYVAVRGEVESAASDPKNSYLQVTNVAPVPTAHISSDGKHDPPGHNFIMRSVSFDQTFESSSQLDAMWGPRSGRILGTNSRATRKSRSSALRHSTANSAIVLLVIKTPQVC